MANRITACGMALGVLLLFVPVFSVLFNTFYLAAGVSDMIDGPVARRNGSAPTFGAKLDTLADAVFVAAAMIKLLPVLCLPTWLLIGTGLVFLLKLVTAIAAYAARKEFAPPHTMPNKIAGFLLFLFPPTVRFLDARIGGAVCLAAALTAAVSECANASCNRR